MTIQEFYAEVGGSYESFLSRVLTPERAKKYVLMFKNDQTMAELDAAIAEKNFENAFRAIHTMKGLTANLSLDNFHDICCELTEIFRNYNGEPYEDSYKKVKDKYNLIIEKINLLD